VHFPQYLSIGEMTDSAKQLVTDKLKSGTFSSKNKQEIDKILDFITKAWSSNGSAFCNKMKELDAIRKENFSETHPEIAKAMGYDAT
jgi:hypothetical protein